MSTTESTPSSVAQLADEFARRFRNGERPSLSEYTSRYPDHADEIRELFPALVALEQFGPGDDGDVSPSPVPVGGQGNLSQLGDFRIIREVGRGGMGVVYEAEQVSLGRRVALKVLPKQMLLDSKHAKRFEREARAAAKLHHTNIVPVFGVGQQDGLHYYVMQFIHGLGLDEVLLELQRLRVEGQESRGKGQAAVVGVQASACAGVGLRDSARERQPEGWIPTRNSAVRVAQSLLSGQFDRTLLVESDSGSDQPSAVSDEPQTPPKSKIQDRESKIASPSTTVAHLSDTFALPGQSEQTSKAQSRTTYWHSVARIGVQAAEALQYAHNQGIIHRDVKPGNLLLDTRGCVWVTDFGLAKATDQQDLTHTGDVLGTLRYMAPEQFDGKADGRSDVYSLGLTLYELLALQPGFDETDRHKLVKQVTTGTPVRLRTLDRHVPRDLETIVHKAIEREPKHRYATADDLAADLRRYLGDEPIHARRPPVLQRLAKWGRRHRAVIVTASLCLLVGTALLAGTIGWAVRDRADRQTRLTSQAELILDEVQRLEQQQNWPEALAAARRAEAVADGGQVASAVDAEVRDTLRELEFVQQLDKIRMQRAVWRDGGYDNAGAADSYGRAFREFGVNLDELSADEAVSRLKEHADILLPIAAALDDFSEVQLCCGSDDFRLYLVDVARGLDPDPLRDQFREMLGRPITPHLQTELRALVERMKAGGQPPATLMLINHTLSRAGFQDLGESLLREAQLHHPDDFWINFDLATRAAESDDLEGAMRLCIAALAARPSSNVAYNKLGIVLQKQKRFDDAEFCFRRAIEIDSDDAIAHNNLGHLLQDQNRLNDAETSLRRAIEIDSDYAIAHSNLGGVLFQQDRPDEGEVYCRRAIELDRDCVAAHNNLGLVLRAQDRPEEAEASYRQAIQLDADFALAHWNLGNLLRDLNGLAEAEECYRRAIELAADFAPAHRNLGAVLQYQNRLNDAETSLRRAIEIDPDDVDAHSNLGGVLFQQDRPDEAEVYCRRAIELDRDYVGAHNNLGLVLRAQDRLEEAEASYRQAIQLDPDFAFAHWNLGDLLRDQDRPVEAEESYRRAIELEPDDPKDHNDLGLLLKQQGKLEQAEAAFREAIERDAGFFAAHLNLGVLLAEQNRPEEAEPSLRRAIELDSHCVPAHFNLGVLLLQQERYDEAEASFLPVNAQAFEKYADELRDSPHDHLRQNNLSAACVNLAHTLREQGRSAEAVPYLNQALELGAVGRGFWIEYALCYKALGNDADYDRGCQKFIEEYPPADQRSVADWGHMSQGLYRLGKYEAAREGLEKTIELRRDDGPSLTLGPRWWYYVLALCRLGETERAQAYYNQLAKLMKDEPPSPLKLYEDLEAEAADLLGLEQRPRSNPGAAEIATPVDE